MMLVKKYCIPFITTILLLLLVSCRSTQGENFPENTDYFRGQSANRLQFHTIHFQSPDQVGLALIVRSGGIDQFDDPAVASQTAALLLEKLKAYLQDKHITSAETHAEVDLEYTLFTVIIPTIPDSDVLRDAIGGMVSVLDNNILSDLESTSVSTDNVTSNRERHALQQYDSAAFPYLTYKSTFSKYTAEHHDNVTPALIRDFHKRTYSAGVSDLIVIADTPTKELKKITRRRLSRPSQGTSIAMRRPYKIPQHAETLYNTEEISAGEYQVQFIKKDIDQLITIPRMEFYTKGIISLLAENVLTYRNTNASNQDGLVLEHVRRIPFTLGTSLNTITARYTLSEDSSPISPEVLSDMLEKQANISAEEWEAGYAETLTYLNSTSNPSMKEYLDTITHAVLYSLPILAQEQYSDVYKSIMDGIEKTAVEDWIKQFAEQSNRVVIIN